MNIDDRLRQEVGIPLAGLLKKFVDTREQKTQLQFYTGFVVNNADPDKLGRCKIRVMSVFGDIIPDDDLPWAIPDFNFIGSSLGSFVVPPIDGLVKVYFDNNDYHTPRYTTKVIETNRLNFTAGKDEDYPDTMVFFETDDGEYFKINRKTYTSTYRHASGLMVIIDKLGNLTIDNKKVGEGNVTINVEGNTTLNCGGNIDAIAEGDVTVQGNSIKLKTQDGGMWQPNTVSKCFFNGQHHGGSLTGTGVGGPIEFIEGDDI